MGEGTKIEWADNTFNGWYGCARVSPGCENCYAEALMDKRWGKVEWGPGKSRVRTAEGNWRQPIAWNKKAEADGTRPRVFSASLSDWLDAEVPAEWLADLLGLIYKTPALVWMMLTKRPQLFRARLGAVLALRGTDGLKGGNADGRLLADRWLEGEPPANVWVGTTVEDQRRAEERLPRVLAIPARVRFLSCEPLLGVVDLSPWLWDWSKVESVDERGGVIPPAHGGIHWIIAGGETGADARPMPPAWARTLRDQAEKAGVAFHFKQHGDWAPARSGVEVDAEFHGGHAFDSAAGGMASAACLPAAGTVGNRYALLEGGQVMEKIGKHKAGRVLDGRTWDELPAFV